MQLPWVSRRYADFLRETLDRVIKERDEMQIQLARANDAMIAVNGFAPTSTIVRDEVAAEREVQQSFEDEMALCGDSGGMISDAFIDEAVGGLVNKAN